MTLFSPRPSTPEVASTAFDSTECFSAALTRVALDPARAEQLHEILGTYCHQCRNLLNTLNISIYLAKRGPDSPSSEVWRQLESQYQEVEVFIERLQWICRPVPLRCVELSLQLLFEGRAQVWSKRLAAVGRNLILEPPEQPAVGRFDPSRLELAFDDLVSWRSLRGNPDTDLRLRWRADASRFQVEWDEPPRKCSHLTADESLVMSRPEPSKNSLQDLALPLLARVMSLHGGSISGSLRDPFSVALTWPLAAPAC